MVPFTGTLGLPYFLAWLISKITTVAESLFHGHGPSPKNSFNNRQIADGIAKGDLKVFSDFHQQTFDRVYGFALKISRSSQVAREIAQEAYTQCWMGKHKYFKVDDPTGYLLKITMRVAAERIEKAAKRRETVDLDTLGATLLEHPLPAVEFKLLDQQIEKVLLGLPPLQAEAFRLRKDEFTLTEISTALNLSVTTVARYLQKTKEIIQKQLPEISPNC